MRILGIDPGLKITGYGLIESDGRKTKLIEAGIIQPRTRDPLQIKLLKIFENLDEIVTSHRPDVMVLEKLYTHYQRPVIATVMGHVRGVICLICAKQGLDLVEHSVKRIRKSLTGTGGATKVQTQKMVAHTLHVSEKGLMPDASDALALALGYAQSIGKTQ